MTVTAVEFDPFSDRVLRRPDRLYRRLRDEAPVYFSERYGFYALSRFADVVTAHRDWRRSPRRTASTVDSSRATPTSERSLGMIS